MDRRKSGFGAVERLRTARARALHKAMLEAHASSEEAYERYQNAFTVARAVDEDTAATLRNEGKTFASAMKNYKDAAMAATLRNEGKTFASALKNYKDAAMAWLAYVETHFRPLYKSKRAGPSS